MKDAMQKLINILLKIEEKKPYDWFNIKQKKKNNN